MRRPLAPLRLLAVLLLAVQSASADTIRVPKDHPSIQAALFAAEPGDVVLVSKGTYEGTIQWFKKGGVTLRAKGKVTLSLPPGASASTPILEIHDITDVQLEGFRFVGSGTGIGLDLDNVAGLIVRGCTFRDLGTGLRTGAVCRGLLISENDLKNVGTGLDLDGSRRSTVADNELMDVTGPAITGHNLQEVSIRDNEIRDAAEGVAVTGASRQVRVSGNTVKQCQVGIAVAGDAVSVHGNAVKQCGEGVQLGDISTDTASAEDNRIVGCEGDGLVVRAQSSVIARNRVLKSGGVGLDLEFGSHLVEDNRIRASGSTGVLIGESLVTLGRNTIRKSGDVDIDAVFGLGSVQLLDNDYGTLTSGF